MKDKLDTIASPHILRFGHNEIKGAWTSLSNWEQLPDGYPAMEVVLGGDSGVALLATFHLILPSPVLGSTIRIKFFAKRVNFRQKGVSSPLTDFIQLYSTASSSWTNGYSGNYGAYQDVTDASSYHTDFTITCTKQHNLSWGYWSFPKFSVLPVTTPV